MVKKKKEKKVMVQFWITEEQHKMLEELAFPEPKANSFARLKLLEILYEKTRGIAKRKKEGK